MTKPDLDFENRIIPDESLTSSTDVHDSMTVPVLEEEIEVHKRSVTTGIVHIRKVVREQEEVVDVPLMANNVEVVRTAVNRIVEGPIPVRYEGDTAVYSVVEEAVVVIKQFLLKEELRISYRTSEVHQPQTITLRKEELLVERHPAPELNQN